MGSSQSVLECWLAWSWADPLQHNTCYEFLSTMATPCQKRQHCRKPLPILLLLHTFCPLFSRRFLSFERWGLIEMSHLGMNTDSLFSVLGPVISLHSPLTTVKRIFFNQSCITYLWVKSTYLGGTLIYSLSNTMVGFPLGPWTSQVMGFWAFYNTRNELLPAEQASNTCGKWLVIRIYSCHYHTSRHVLSCRSL